MKAVIVAGCLVVFAALALAVNFPADGSCVTYASTDNYVSIPVIGLSQDPSKQCAYVRTAGGMDYTYNIDLTGWDKNNYDFEVLVWNKNRRPTADLATTINISGSNTKKAYAVPTVDATTGAITAVTVVYGGEGYTSASASAQTGSYNPTSSATLQAVVNARGQVVSVLVLDGGSGYPANTQIFDTTWMNVKVQYTKATLNGLPTTGSFSLSTFDYLRDPSCPSDPLSSPYYPACIDFGFHNQFSAGDFGDCAAVQLLLFTRIPMDVGITIRLIGTTEFSKPHVKPGVPATVLGVPGHTSEQFIVDLPRDTTAVPRSEFRITLDTPDRGNWLCRNNTGNNYWFDCDVDGGRLSKIQVDPFYRVDYPYAPIVDVSPASRGITTVNVANGGSYNYVPGIAVDPPTVSYTTNSARIHKYGSGYKLADGTLCPPSVSPRTLPTTVTAQVDVNGKLTGLTVNALTQSASLGSAIDLQMTITPWYQVIAFALSNTNNGGGGYDSVNPPGIAISAPSAVGGVAAQASVVLGTSSSGAVVDVRITNPTTNWGYTVNGPATLVIGRRVLSFTVTTPGTGYTSAPTVSLNCFDYSGQFAATAVLSGNGVQSININNPGVFDDSCALPLTVTLNGGGGAGAAATVSLTPGSGAQFTAFMRPIEDQTSYAEFIVTGSNHMQVRRSPIVKANLQLVTPPCGGAPTSVGISSVSVLDAGSGYSATPLATVTSGAGTVTVAGVSTGTDATAHATVDSNGLVTSVVIDNAGAGYTSAPKVVLRTIGRITRVRVGDHGWGYDSAPDVTFSAPTSGWGRAARGVAVFNAADGSVSGITITDPGYGYTSAPSVDIQAVGTIKTIKVAACNGGTGYTTAPAVRVRNLGGGVGYGFQGTAILTGGVVTGVTVVNGGRHYDLNSLQVDFVGGVYTTPASSISGGSVWDDVDITDKKLMYQGSYVNSVEVFWENGMHATAVAAVDGSGAVSSIRVIKAGPVYSEQDLLVGGADTRLNFGIGSRQPVARLRLDASGQLIDAESRGSYSSGGSDYWNPQYTAGTWWELNNLPNVGNPVGATADFTGDGYSFTPRVGANEATESGLLTYYTPWGWFPLSYTKARLNIQYGATQKVFSYQDPDMVNFGSAPHVQIRFPLGTGVDYPQPGTYLTSTLNAAGYFTTTVTFDVMDYPDITNTKVSSMIMYDGRFARPVRFLVKPATAAWTRVWFEITVTSGNSDSLYLGSWQMGDLATPAEQMRGYMNVAYPQELFAPAIASSPSGFIVELSTGGCSGNAAGDTVSFDITAHVVVGDDPATGGECSSQLDCIETETHGPAPRSQRIGLSANQNAYRFSHCITQFNGTARCAECFSDCDCQAGQYCYKDNGLCQDAYGFNYVCDEQSYQKYATCQWKDPDNKIFGRQCYTHLDVGDSNNNTAENLVGVCGEGRYYNSSFVVPGQPWVNLTGVNRVTLWEGVCVDNMCLECAEANHVSATDLHNSPVGTCYNHFICTDGFFSRRSGNSLQGALTQDNEQKTRDAVRTSAGVGGASLFFIIVITILLGLGVICMFRKGGGASAKTAPAPAVQMSSVP